MRLQREFKNGCKRKTENRKQCSFVLFCNVMKKNDLRKLQELKITYVRVLEWDPIYLIFSDKGYGHPSQGDGSSTRIKIYSPTRFICMCGWDSWSSPSFSTWFVFFLQMCRLFYGYFVASLGKFWYSTTFVSCQFVELPYLFYINLTTECLD